jgi:O-antigen/teichoic acid export membrane protein
MTHELARPGSIVPIPVVGRWIGTSSRKILAAAILQNPPFHLTGGRLLARNTLWNLLGSGAPALVALLAIPILIRHIGVFRFGVLTIIWTVVSYFSLFDLGLGSALTRMVADRLGKGQDDEIPSLVWTSLALMLSLSILGAIVLAAWSPALVRSILKVPAPLQAESLRAFLLLAGCLPFMIVTTGLRGVLEAQQRFGMVNAIRIPTNALTFAAPLAVLPFSNSLVPLVAVLAVGRVLAGMAYLMSCLKAMPKLGASFACERRHIGYVLRFGSWMTVSNVVGPLLFYADRMLIGAMVSLAAVAYYATPFEVVGRLLTIPGALAGVLFPAFTVTFAQDRARTAWLLLRGQKYIFLAMFPVILVIVTLANDGLRLWLGTDFANHSTAVLRWLAVGVFLNSMASLPWVLIQGAGRPDLTAKLHMSELALYLPVLWFMVKHYGILGAAIGWTVRVLLDAMVLFFAAQHFLHREDRFLRRMAAAAGGGLTWLWVATLPATLSQRAVFLAAALLLLVGISLVFILPEERRLLSVMVDPLRRAFAGTEATQDPLNQHSRKVSILK